MDHKEDRKSRLKKVCEKCREAQPLSQFGFSNRRHSEICRQCTQRARIERHAQRMAERENIPERLVNWRRRENLTQKEAAIRLGLPYGTYVGYEQNHRGKSMNEDRYKKILDLTAFRSKRAKT